MKRLVGILFVALLLLLPQWAQAQRLISRLSTQQISIDSTFDGESLTLFGNVEPRIGEQGDVGGPFDVIVMIQGPAVTRVVREKTPQFGIWLNTRQAVFSGMPAFFHVLSTRPLQTIAPPEKLAQLDITLQSHIQDIRAPSGQTGEEFSGQLQRLMAQEGMFGISPHGISFMSNTFYSARLDLPSSVPNGSYLATTFLFRDGELVDRKAERFFVRTTGMERFVANAARDFPLAYGIASVLLALFTGWLGGVAFRR